MFRTVFFLSISSLALLSCSSRKKVVVLAPPKESQGAHGEIVYKETTEEINTLVSDLLLHAFENIDSGFFSNELPPQPIFCGPNLWRQIKSNLPPQDSLGSPITVMLPNFDPNLKDQQLELEARQIKDPKDLQKFIQYLSQWLGTSRNFKIRKLNQIEQQIYWTFNSWNIEEPVFIVEAGQKIIVVDVLKTKNNPWHLFYLDEISQIIDRAQKSREISQTQDVVADLSKQEKIPEAELEAILNVKTAEKTFGKRHPKYAMAVGNLASVYLQKPDHAKAEELFLEAGQVYYEIYGEDNGYLIFIYYNLGNLLAGRQEYDKADTLLTKAISILEKQTPDDKQTKAIIFNSLATLYTNQKKFAQALDIHQRGLALFKEQFGENHPNVAISYNNLGEYYFDQKNYSAADSTYRLAEKILLSQLGATHGLTKGIQANIGRNLVYLKRYSEAEPLLLHSLEYKEGKYGKLSQELIETLEGLVLLYKETQHPEKSKHYLRWVDEIKSETKADQSTIFVPLQ